MGRHTSKIFCFGMTCLSPSVMGDTFTSDVPRERTLGSGAIALPNDSNSGLLQNPSNGISDQYHLGFDISAARNTLEVSGSDSEGGGSQASFYGTIPLKRFSGASSYSGIGVSAKMLERDWESTDYQWEAQAFEISLSGALAMDQWVAGLKYAHSFTKSDDKSGYREGNLRTEEAESSDILIDRIGFFARWDGIENTHLAISLVPKVKRDYKVKTKVNSINLTTKEIIEKSATKEEGEVELPSSISLAAVHQLADNPITLVGGLNQLSSNRFLSSKVSEASAGIETTVYNSIKPRFGMRIGTGKNYLKWSRFGRQFA